MTQSMASQINKYKVIIVGGGIAGLAAAQRLFKNGIKNIILLEAQSQLGGRIKTVQHGDHCLEYGAHWIHGEDGNVVYAIGKERDLIDEEISLKQTGIGRTIFVKEDSSEVGEEVVDKFQIVMANLTEKGNKELLTYKDSLGKYYTHEFQKVNEWGTLGMELLDWYGRFQCCIDGADTWFDVSGAGIAKYEECEGNQVVNWTSGYKSLIDHFKNTIPHHIAKLNSPVKKIKWDNSKFNTSSSDVNLRVSKPEVQVELVSGNLVTGDHVIVTQSLAVLKSSADNLFEPTLPSKKLNAINVLGIDVVDKIYMEFPSQWWDSNCDGFSFLRNTSKDQITEENWENDILGFYEVFKQPRMLCGWITGKAAKLMEASNDMEVKDRCLNLMKRYLGVRYSIPEPVWWDRTKWYSNPFIRGSYSFPTVKSQTLGVTAEDLAEPIYNSLGSPVVCFAGEATHSKYYSTVHGAVESGWREADRLIHQLMSHQAVSLSHQVESYEVVIIGAGAAGLGAAKELEAKGVSSILILEATDHVGGRIKTFVPPSGGFYDIGAQWVHGQDGNKLYELTCKHDLIDERPSLDGDGDFYTEKGEKIPQNLIDEVFEVMTKIRDECRGFTQSRLENYPPSTGHFYSAMFEEYLNECSRDPASVKLLKQYIYHWIMRWERIDNACDSLYQLAAKQWGEYSYCGGFDNMNPRNGMSSLINSIRNEVKAEIRLNAEVSRVDYASSLIYNKGRFARKDGTSPIIIDYSNQRRVECQFVIVTSSLGFLKQNRHIFHPALPSILDKAITNIGFGVIDKIFIEFEEPWWDKDFIGLQLVWTDGAPSFDRSSPNTQLVNGQLLKIEDFWYRAISGFDLVFGHKSSLCGWISGPEAEYMETLEESVIAQTCVQLMRQFTKNKSIPDPKNVYRSQWAMNKYCLGSYSHNVLSNTSASDDISVNDLNHPVCASAASDIEVPVLVLAGEANNEEFYSTVHGALSSGMSQAQRFIEFKESVKQISHLDQLKSKL